MEARHLIYVAFEIFFVLYLSFVFFQIGRARNPRYIRLRQRITGVVPWLNSNNVCYLVSILVLSLLVIRFVEGSYNPRRPPGARPGPQEMNRLIKKNSGNWEYRILEGKESLPIKETGALVVDVERFLFNDVRMEINERNTAPIGVLEGREYLLSTNFAAERLMLYGPDKEFVVIRISKPLESTADAVERRPGLDAKPEQGVKPSR